MWQHGVSNHKEVMFAPEQAVKAQMLRGTAQLFL